MAIFPQIDHEAVVQVGDMTRIDVSRSFVSAGEAAISLIEIRPEASGSFFTVTANQYLDWAYETAGDKVVTVRVATDGSPASKTATISALSESDDNLFSSDADLKLHEHDIMQWLPQGRSSWKHVHRRAQALILAYLDKEGKTDIHGNKFTKAAFVDVSEGREWSTFLALRLIFEGLSNAVDDVFSQKAKRYESLEILHRDRVFLRIDVDGDGEVDVREGIDGLRTARVVRR